jgi:hypothetical protein
MLASLQEGTSSGLPLNLRKKLKVVSEVDIVDQVDIVDILDNHCGYFG